ncbi:origin recognition complex subunit 4-like [Oscarella lobularis]|uniref:origin recognition complex subunit 4-like n=1 Tax=Oscarella lobularis TaxID=121494 RepID=UPI003313F540
MAIVPAADRSLDELKIALRRRVFQNRLTELPEYLREAKQKVIALLEQPIKFGQSTSALLIGHRGSGKSALLNSALENLRENEEFTKVYLNGLVQCDDRTALREIAYQLSLASELEETISIGSFAEVMGFLVETLNAGDERSKAIVFVLDEFDQFAQHAGQKLLYGLLEIAQSARTPVAIVGLTCRLDVVELLEKRVRSRFSHQLISLFTRMPFDTYLDAFRECLKIPSDFSDDGFRSTWTSNLEGLLQDAKVIKILRHFYNISTDIRALHNLLALPIVKLSADHPLITAEDLAESAQELTMETRPRILKDISVLELCLLISMSHLTENLNGKPFNFETAYEEFRKFASKSKVIQTFSKPVALKALDHFLSLELVVPHTGTGKSMSTQRDRFLLQLGLDPDEVRKAVETYPNCPTEIGQWAKSSITV